MTELMGEPKIIVNVYDISNVEQNVQYPQSLQHQGQFVVHTLKGIPNTPVLCRNQSEFLDFFGSYDPIETGHPSQYVQYNYLKNQPQWIIRQQKEQTYQQKQVKFDLTEKKVDNEVVVGHELHITDSEVLNIKTLEEQQQQVQSQSQNTTILFLQKFPGVYFNNRLQIKIEPIQNTPQGSEIPKYGKFRQTILFDSQPVETFDFVFEKNTVDSQTGKSLYIQDVFKSSKYVTQIHNTNQGGQSFINKLKDVTENYQLNQFITTLSTGTEVLFDDQTVDSEQHVSIVNNKGQQINEQQQQQKQKLVQELQSLFDMFVEYDLPFDYVSNQGWVSDQIIKSVIGVQEQKKDQVQIIDIQNQTKRSDFETQVTNQSTNINSSYQQIFYPWLMTYNTNNQQIYIPPSQLVLPKLEEIDSTLGYHVQQQGQKNGKVVDLSVGSGVYMMQFELTRNDRDQLYNNSINPFYKEINSQIYIWGNKTQYQMFSKLNRLSVRRFVSLNVVKELKNRLKPYLFEVYNQNTLTNISNTLYQFRNELIQSGQVEDQQYEISQTDEQRNRNEVSVSFRIIPVGTLEYITINVFVLQSGMEVTVQ